MSVCACVFVLFLDPMVNSSSFFILLLNGISVYVYPCVYIYVFLYTCVCICVYINMPHRVVVRGVAVRGGVPAQRGALHVHLAERRHQQHHRDHEDQRARWNVTRNTYCAVHF